MRRLVTLEMTYRMPPLREHQNDTPWKRKKEGRTVIKFGEEGLNADAQIVALSQRIEFYLTEYLFRGTFGQKINNGDFIIPTYQREDTWEHHRKSRFIESLILGVPIPFLFLAYPHQPLDEAHSAPGCAPAPASHR
ncbi:MAG TPA: DUF262 domain-containing protein [Xylella fastidiosa subsp. pauca]